MDPVDPFRCHYRRARVDNPLVVVRSLRGLPTRTRVWRAIVGPFAFAAATIRWVADARPLSRRAATQLGTEALYDGRRAQPTCWRQGCLGESRWRRCKFATPCLRVTP